jgi:phosphohistidine phosphatase
MTTELSHRLVLLRHAKAEPAGGISDELRPLALAGRRQCPGVGAALSAAGLVPEHVLVSSAVRTRQTWELVCTGLGDVPEPEVDVDDRLYGAGPGDVVDLVRALDDRVRQVLVVGHEPTMSGTAALLAGDGDGAHLAQVRTGLPTGAFAVLEVATWSQLAAGAGRLLDVVRPAR